MAASLLALLGLGSTAAASLTQGARPWLLGASGAMIALSFYYAYVRRPSRRSRIVAWAAASVSAGAIAAGWLFGHAS